jgi:hypothetical protein
MSRFPLEPLSIGQILDRVFRLYRENFLTFLGIVAVFQIPVVIFSTLLTFVQLELQQSPEVFASPEMVGGLILGSFGVLGLSVVISLISYFSVAALARATMMRYMGEPVTIIDAYRGIGREWVQIILVLVLFLILSLFLGVVGLITCSLLGLSFFLAIAMELAIPIIVIERQRAAGALRRAWDLVRRRFWWVLGFYFVLYLLQMLVVSGPSTLAQFLVGGVFPEDPFAPSTASLIVPSIISGFLGILFLPLRYTASVLLYFDLRVRTEGLDLALKSAAGEAGAASPAAVLAQAPAPERDSIITTQEYLWMVGITIGGIFLLVALSVVLSGLLFGLGLGL